MNNSSDKPSAVHSLPSGTGAAQLVSRVPPAGLNWVSKHDIPFGDSDSLTGIYLVRNTRTKEMVAIELNGPMWGSPIEFDEYAFVAPRMDGWVLRH